MRVRLPSLALVAVALTAVGGAAAGCSSGDTASVHAPAIPSATSAPVRGEVLAAVAAPAPSATATVAAWPTIAAPTATPPPLPAPISRPAALLPPPAEGDATAVRFWSNGDSTSYFMSVWLSEFLAARGAVATQPAPEYHVSSGLLTPQRFDWPAYIAAEMAARDPNVVAFMVGANDAHPGMPLDEYARRVGALMDQVQAPGRRVLWVGQPNMGRADLAASIPAMNAVFAHEAGLRPWVTYVDTWAATSDANGAYTAYLPDETGAPVRARGDDGVHFTSAGGRILALAVLRAYDALP